MRSNQIIRRSKNDSECSRSLFGRDHLLLPSGRPACRTCYEIRLARDRSALPPKRSLASVPPSRKYGLPGEVLLGRPSTKVTSATSQHSGPLPEYARPTPARLQDDAGLATMKPTTTRGERTKSNNSKKSRGIDPLRSNLTISTGLIRSPDLSSSPEHCGTEKTLATHDSHAPGTKLRSKTVPALAGTRDNLPKDICTADKSRITSEVVSPNRGPQLINDPVFAQARQAKRQAIERLIQLSQGRSSTGRYLSSSADHAMPPEDLAGPSCYAGEYMDDGRRIGLTYGKQS